VLPAKYSAMPRADMERRLPLGLLELAFLDNEVIVFKLIHIGFQLVALQKNRQYNGQ
jgi:hypothetical protein